MNDIVAIVRERRAGAAQRLLTSADHALLNQEDRLQLEAVALPLLTEEEILQKWVGWLSSSLVPLALLVQQLAKRLVSLPEDRRGSFAQRLHELLITALAQGKVQPAPQEKLQDHEKIVAVLKPHLLLLPPAAPRPQTHADNTPTNAEESFRPRSSALGLRNSASSPRVSAASAPPPPAHLPIEPNASPARRPLMARTKPELQSLPDHPPVQNQPRAKAVMDVRPPKLLGPIEELKTLGLEDWRRLSVTPAERTAKIESMIAVAGNENVGARRQAVLAWIESPVMQLQRALGFAGLEGDQALVAEIARREQSGQPTLSKEEFEALADLAEQL